MIRKKKKYEKPKKQFERARIEEENKLRKEYGLKNKREIWKTLAKVKYYRNRAKSLANASSEEQEVLFNKLRALGLNINNISDVLDLRVEDLLKRRLSTIVEKKKLANTVKQARQMVAHRKVLIRNRVVNSPSYLVSVEDEDAITIKYAKEILKKEEPTES